jgi:thiol:disulfide interchange protein DsbD
MRIVFLFLVMTVMSVVSFAQPGGDWTDKVNWTFKVEKIDESNAFIIATARLAEHWHLFSVDHDMAKASFTGMPTSFLFSENPNYNLIGKLQDAKKPVTHEDVLGISLFFEGKGIFKQKIQVLTDKEFDINFEYEFQICDEMGCLFPPAQEATIKISGFKPNSGAIEKIEENPKVVKVEVQESLIPDSSVTSHTDTSITGEELKGSDEMLTVDNSNSNNETRGLWSLFLEGLVWGFVALLTPCVFPMIPMTVSFFTKQSTNRSKGIANALIYGFFIVLIYVSIGLAITLLSGSSSTVYEMSTSAYMNIPFFIIFMVFAFSFLGAFEIRMPTKWVNSADNKADKGGILGIFFMAFTLALVSFSCTGPIIGSSLVQAISSGNISGPAVIMLGFSIALSLPFMLFAVFPGMMNSMPQSGGWLNSVKVVLGLLEIALALKFFSMVDMAYHWDILTREIFVATWIVIFVVMGFYLLGKIRFVHDSPIESISVTRFMFAFSALTFAIYLLPGMWGAPLTAVDGVAPPRTHSEDNFEFSRGIVAEPTDALFLEYREHMHKVADGSILVFHELEIAREYAEKLGKPLLIDFTGHSCANCRKTESTVWTDDEIRPILQDQLVIVSLYCDDRERLPESEWVYSDAIKGKIKTVGNKWSAYQIENYGQISQPLYVVQDHDGKDLTQAIGYTPDIDEYREFLELGISRFEKRHILEVKL